MEKEIITRIRERFSLETEALLTEQQIKNLTEDVRMEKYLLRERKVARAEYDGSVKKMLDTFRGKKAERIEELDRAIRQSEASLQSCQRQLECDRQTMAELETRISSLPDRRTLREQAAGDPDAEREYARQTALFCAFRLEPMLRDCLTSLEEQRRIVRGERAGEIMSQRDRVGILAKPEELAEKICPVLTELKEALEGTNQELTVGQFFTSPALFLNPAAAHNRIDRVSQAIGQVERVRKEILSIGGKLEDGT